MNNLTPMLTLSTPPAPMTMDFYDAIKAIMDLKIVRRLEWGNEDYCLLESGILKIFTKGKLHNWIINDGDVLGTDWVEVKGKN